MNHAECKYDIEGLASELEVTLSDLAPLFSSYFDEMSEAAGEMELFLLDGEWNKLQRVVHNIKGVSVNLGIKDVYSAAGVLDALLKEGEYQEAGIHVKIVLSILADARENIEKYFEERGFAI